MGGERADSHHAVYNGGELLTRPKVTDGHLRHAVRSTVSSTVSTCGAGAAVPAVERVITVPPGDVLCTRVFGARDGQLR